MTDEVPTPGRPTDYDPAFCDRVLELGREGKSKAQIAAALGFCRQTIDNWSAAHPEFLDAITKAKDLALAWWEDQGQEGIGKSGFNATAFIFQMKNRFRDDYADRMVNEHSGLNGGPIRTEDASAAKVLSEVRELLEQARNPEVK